MHCPCLHPSVTASSPSNSEAEKSFLRDSSTTAAATVLFPFQSTWSNETFATQLCAQMNAGDATSVRIAPQSGIFTGVYFVIPDCFYTKAGLVTTLYLDSIILQGDPTHPNPLNRVAAAISQTPSSFSLYRSRIVLNTGARASIDWNGISSITSSVEKLDIQLTDLGAGSTVPTFPTYIPYVALISCGLSGQLPTQLYQSQRSTVSKDFQINFSDNDLSGPISSTFLTGLDHSSRSVLLLLSNNRLSGEFPSSLFAGHFASCLQASINLDNNAFTGPLNNIFASTTFNESVLQVFTVTGNNNDFDGVLPSWLGATTTLSLLNLNCDNCKLTSVGNSPFVPSPTGSSDIVVSVKNNLITGPIPSSFFDIPYPAGSFHLLMSGNNLGSLPSDLFDQANFAQADYVTFDFSNAGLTGQLPNRAGVFGTSRNVYKGNFNDNNMMTGTLPPTFLASIRPQGTPSNTLTSIEFNITNTGLTGDLALPILGDVASSGYLALSLDASNSRFTSISFPNSSYGLRSLNIGNNPTLTGSLPSSLFQLNPSLEVLSAFNTKLSGTMPDMGTLNPGVLKTLDLSDTDIDFCSGDRITWISSKLTSCQLEHTTAFNCTSEYPSVCVITAPPPVVPTAPVFEPQISQPISTPVTTPIASEIPAPSTTTPLSNPDIGPVSVPIGASPTPISEPSVLPTPPNSATRPAICVAISVLICMGMILM